MSVPTNKRFANKIAPHIYSALRDLGMIFVKSILSRNPILVGAERAGNADSYYGIKH